MNMVEIGTEATQFPEKKYINGIFVAVQSGAFIVPSSTVHLTPNCQIRSRKTIKNTALW
jgi:hypothetical protein